MAVRADSSRAWLCSGENRNGGLWRPESAGRRALRPPVDGRALDCEAASGRLLPGARGTAGQEIRIRWWTRNRRRFEAALRQRFAQRGPRAVPAGATGFLAACRYGWAREELFRVPQRR